ncbi:hypothetical protein LCGC14_1870770 [marine sediment metagenome]|uniref:VRR-NUC domain-containing protein n=1 Tax=marine sediment metagenome TaxID=412755 RepID=A0A0F9IJ46_9ZZZZ
MTSERDIQADIWRSVSQFSRLFRNNVGAFKQAGKFIRFGLTKGSSDLIGWTPVEITQDMVGSTVAVFTAIECKTKAGKATPAQLYFVERVKLDGGYAAIARSVEDAMKAIGKG